MAISEQTVLAMQQLSRPAKTPATMFNEVLRPLVPPSLPLLGGNFAGARAPAARALAIQVKNTAVFVTTHANEQILLTKETGEALQQ